MQKYRNDFSRSDSVLPTYVLAPRSCRVTFEAEDEEEEFLSQVMALTKLDDTARVIVAVSRYRYIDAAKFIELGMNSPQGYSHVLLLKQSVRVVCCLLAEDCNAKTY